MARSFSSTAVDGHQSGRRLEADDLGLDYTISSDHTKDHVM